MRNKLFKGLVALFAVAALGLGLYNCEKNKNKPSGEFWKAARFTHDQGTNIDCLNTMLFPDLVEGQAIPNFEFFNDNSVKMFFFGDVMPGNWSYNEEGSFYSVTFGGQEFFKLSKRDSHLYLPFTTFMKNEKRKKYTRDASTKIRNRQGGDAECLILEALSEAPCTICDHIFIEYKK